jgi:hypothetical protein
MRRGFRVNVVAPLSKDAVIRLCRTLARRFRTGVFTPDASGFILWTLPQATMRITLSKRSGVRWPLVPQDCMTSWVGNDAAAVGTGPRDAFLTGHWTLEDVTALKECLGAHGIRVAHMPRHALA